GIAKLQAHVTPSPAAALEHELDPVLSEELPRFEQIVDAVHLERHMMERQVFILGSEGGVCGTRDEPECVVIRAITKEDHAELIAIGLLEPEDVSIELHGPLDVRDMKQDMADFARANRCRHDFSLPALFWIFRLSPNA